MTPHIFLVKTQLCAGPKDLATTVASDAQGGVECFVVGLHTVGVASVPWRLDAIIGTQQTDPLINKCAVPFTPFHLQ